MNTNIICKILKNNTQFLLLNKECFFKKYLFFYFIENIQKLFLNACLDGYINFVKLLLQDPRVNPSDKDNKAIRLASKYGRIEVVKLLLQDTRVDPSDINNYAIRWASAMGYVEVVKLLLLDPRFDPSYLNIRYGFISACQKGNIDMIKILIQYVTFDQTIYDDGIYYAKMYQHISIVELLLYEKQKNIKR